MNILIISGFLGAGKTTFIKMLAQKTHHEIAILENEYASIGIDSSVLSESSSDNSLNIWELTEGCICCSTKEDFAASVLTIANTIDPEYLIVEPTGVAVPGNIVEQLRQIEYERITILAPITIADGCSCSHYLNEYSDLYRSQLTGASTILVSKMEHASTEELQFLELLLRRENPHAEIITEHYSRKPDDWWEALLLKKADGTILSAAHIADSLLPDTFSLQHISLNTPEQLWYILEQLIHGAYGNIIRAKGFVPAGDQLLQFDAADGRYSFRFLDPSEEFPDHTAARNGKAIFIGTGIQRQTLRSIFFEASKKIRVHSRTFSSSVMKSISLPNTD